MRTIPTSTGGVLHLAQGITLASARRQLSAAGYALRSGPRGRLLAYRLH